MIIEIVRKQKENSRLYWEKVNALSVPEKIFFYANLIVGALLMIGFGIALWSI